LPLYRAEKLSTIERQRGSDFNVNASQNGSALEMNQHPVSQRRQGRRDTPSQGPGRNQKAKGLLTARSAIGRTRLARDIRGCWVGSWPR